MLTLIPGVSGGSENYARELVRALGRVGRHEYRLYLPTIAVDVEGLPSEVVDEYRASRSMRGRLRAMGQASAFGGSIRRRVRALAPPLFSRGGAAGGESLLSRPLGGPHKTPEPLWEAGAFLPRPSRGLGLGPPA